MTKIERRSISDADISEVHEIVVELTTRKRPAGNRTPMELWFDKAATALRDHSIAMLSALFCLLFLSWAFEKESLRDAFLVESAFVGLILLTASFIGIGGAVPFINRLRKAPYSPLLWSVEACSRIDLPLFHRLLRCNRNAIAYMLVQFSHERSSFEKRGAMLAGALDRIGLFPAIAAFVGLATSLWSHSETFVRVLVFLVPAFYFINFLNWMLLQEMDRTIAILKYSLDILEADHEGLSLAETRMLKDIGIAA
ncbi:hypothetical protein AWB77_01463 [Caballeronia fortuita]|uniref:Uncharacterized protein n=1 Tax=Caballeronia fortuita TaxID=1777138 RepID=A0A158A7L9_9BURK|nr:hypothetical protein [Caballeronia fortuita]SAK53760.1 hypothetical protein AWB77_01463 [Caballeronia fortuita]